MSQTRIEKDSLGEVRVPVDALYGAQTQRAVDNFPISGIHLPTAMIQALGLIKQAAAQCNARLGLLPEPIADAIATAAAQVATGRLNQEFPVDIFQTGSGTSSNMNCNEVIANLAGKELGQPIHPNDQVNLGQSSNDVFPTAIHIAARLKAEDLVQALAHLERTIQTKAERSADQIKTGRTHLMDAMPITLAQEMEAWAAQLKAARRRIEQTLPEIQALAIGGTAVGSGINTHPNFAQGVIKCINQVTGIKFTETQSHFAAQSSMDPVVSLSGQLKALATALMKISNDLRWMNSGPVAGLSEIQLPALQPGSSIMPGKINPVIPEAVAMVAAQVMGNDTTITIAGQSGSFQLNTMLPVIAYNLLQSLELLTQGARVLADKAIVGMKINDQQLKQLAGRNPILATALVPEIGYDLAAAIVKTAMSEGRSIQDVAKEKTDLDDETLDRLLDLKRLTGLD
jgi:fumarate hydratase class II